MRKLLILLVLLTGCTKVEMNQDQMRRAYNACDGDDGLAYIVIHDQFGDEFVRAHCRNGKSHKVPFTL